MRCEETFNFSATRWQTPYRLEFNIHLFIGTKLKNRC